MDKYGISNRTTMRDIHDLKETESNYLYCTKYFNVDILTNSEYYRLL